jgi:hypothetical protein
MVNMSQDEEEKRAPEPSFQPRVEAEEGEPTRFDFVVAGIVVVLLVLALLWAFGVIDLPGLPF